MFDFASSNELTEELKTNDIYELFKTESLEFNVNFLSIIEKFPNTFELIEFYIKLDSQNILNLFNNILLTSYRIMNEEDQNIYIPEYESYTFGVCKIVSLLCLIQKINQLQNEIISNTKNYIKNFYKIHKKDAFIREKIDNIINDLISSQITSKRSISRRSTNDITNSSISFHFDNKSKILKNKLFDKDRISNQNSDKNLDFRSFTPKFEEIQNSLEQKKISNNKVKEEIPKRDSIKIESSMTLQKMNFVQQEEKTEKLTRKNLMITDNSKTHRIKNKSCDSSSKKRKQNKSRSTKIKTNFFFKNRNNSVNSCDDRIIQNERRHILAEILDAINILYKDGNISSDKKINMKQIIISNPKTIIDKYFQYHKDTSKDDIINIQCFLLKEFQYL
jgi:hypothetical protein